MRYLTAGESHGPQLTAIIEGVPAQLNLDENMINVELIRRQKGYGRGRRMQIEKDRVKITSGVRHGKTLGSPITLIIENDDWKHWTHVMGSEPISNEEEQDIKRKITKPRPGHADLNGGLKYNHRDLRNVLERSSARETAIRVAVGAVAKQILKQCEIDVAGHVVEIGGIHVVDSEYRSLQELRETTEMSPVRCFNKASEKLMIEVIEQAKQEGDSVGGIVEVIVEGVPIGLGSYVHYDKKLDAKIASSMISINAFKGVEFGLGFKMSERMGSKVHDEIVWNEQRGYERKTNRLGGFEGGMTNGMPIVVRGVMKPIPTLYKPLQSVDIQTKETFQASIERSDSCAVPSASVVAEAVVAWEVAVAILENYGHDRMEQIIENLNADRERMKEF
jgi:chorismate synthase